MVSQASRRGDRSDRGGGGGGGGERRGRGGRNRDRDQRQREDDSGGFSERVVHTRRIAKVVKGGRRLRFNALVVIGDGQGRVGVGMGKALAIPDAVRKGTAVARRGTITIPMKGSTIPHEISVRKGASIVIIKPAPLGTGIIAAGAMRAMLELGGVQDVVGKSLGSRNPINIVQATMEALGQLRDPETERANRLGLNRQDAAAAEPEAAAAPAEAPAPPSEPAPEPAAEAVGESAGEASPEVTAETPADVAPADATLAAATPADAAPAAAIPADAAPADAAPTGETPVDADAAPTAAAPPDAAAATPEPATDDAPAAAPEPPAAEPTDT